MIERKGYVYEVQYNPPENTNLYPFNLNFLNGFEQFRLDEKVTFIVGENGSGKSTLIEAIAIAYGFNREGGSMNFNFSTMDSIPSPSAKIIDSYGGKSLHEQSHGESFLALMNNRFSGKGFYVLDEPEAALSAERQLSFLLRLHDQA